MARTTEWALVLTESAFESVEQPESPRIRAIQARNYRCLRHVDVRVDGNFYVVVGPNGSGKSTLFDVIEFLFDLFNNGLKAATEARTKNFQDLVWARPKESPGFELAVEFLVADQTFRYEVKVEERSGLGVQIVREAGHFGCLSGKGFSSLASKDTIFSDDLEEGLQPIFHRVQRPRRSEYSGTTFHSERNGDTVTLSLPGDASAIGYVGLVDSFPPTRTGGSKRRRMMNMAAANVVIEQLLERRVVQFLQLDSRTLRKPSPRNGDDGSRLTEDGSNLPRVVDGLTRDKVRWRDWLDHINTALPGIRNVRSVYQEWERSDYLIIRYANGAEIPAWGISEGTLRLLALTILAYLPGEQPAAYLLEEPENGIHPMAIEIAYQSLSSIYRSQVFIASHSPTFLRCVKPGEVLCFTQDGDGATVIVHGDEHPTLSKWQGSTDDDLFFAPHILG